MKQTYVKYLMVVALTGGFLFTSCRTARENTVQYEVTKVEGGMITIDSVWAIQLLSPMKNIRISKLLSLFQLNCIDRIHCYRNVFINRRSRNNKTGTFFKLTCKFIHALYIANLAIHIIINNNLILIKNNICIFYIKQL